MSPRWEDLNARARGVATHLLSLGDLEVLSRALDLAGLATSLSRVGIPVGEAEGAATPAALELALRRWAAGNLAILARWVGDRGGALPLVFWEEDRRSLRALARGAHAGTSAERRLAGLLPTPSLPERALEELARAPSIAAIGTLLTVWEHPFAAPFVATSTSGAPDLMALEQELGRLAADTASTAARRSGCRALRRFVAEGIDAENALLALLLARAGDDGGGVAHFLPGGTGIDRSRFVEAIATGDPRRAAQKLVEGRHFPFAKLLLQDPLDVAALEGAFLRARIAELTRRVRLAPLEPMTTVWVALRLRAQLIDLQRIVWMVTLGARGAARTPGWISVAA